MCEALREAPPTSLRSSAYCSGLLVMICIYFSLSHNRINCNLFNNKCVLPQNNGPTINVLECAQLLSNTSLSSSLSLVIAFAVAFAVTFAVALVAHLKESLILIECSL